MGEQSTCYRWNKQACAQCFSLLWCFKKKGFSELYLWLDLSKADFLTTILSCAHFYFSCPHVHRGCAHAVEDMSFFLPTPSPSWWLCPFDNRLRASVPQQLILVWPVVCFGGCGFKNMAYTTITAEGLLPSKHFYKQPDPVLYLLNMFPRQGTRDQIQLVTLERKLAVCVQRQLCLLLFSSPAPSPHLSQDEAFFPKQFSKSKKLIAKFVMCNLWHENIWQRKQ